MQEDELERKAVEELLKEAQRGKTRAETMGAMGWMKCPVASTNKRFLINTIKNTLPPTRERDHDERNNEKDEEESSKEKHSRNHRTHPYKSSSRSGKEESHSPPHRTSKDKKEKSTSKQR
ncbi:protein POLR1D [Discoglossus pictus]